MFCQLLADYYPHSQILYPDTTLIQTRIFQTSSSGFLKISDFWTLININPYKQKSPAPEVPGIQYKQKFVTTGLR